MRVWQVIAWAAFLSDAGVREAHAQGAKEDLRFPSELVRFVPYPGNPVFTPAQGQWDARIRERGWIMRDDGIYKLWYTGYDGSKDGRRMLGYATSPNGIKWTRSPSNPLVKGSSGWKT